MVCGDSSLSDGLKLQPWKPSASGDEVREGMVKNLLSLHCLSGVYGGEGCGASLPIGSGNMNEASVGLAQWGPVSTSPQGWSSDDGREVHMSML